MRSSNGLHVNTFMSNKFMSVSVWLAMLMFSICVWFDICVLKKMFWIYIATLIQFSTLKKLSFLLGLINLPKYKKCMPEGPPGIFKFCDTWRIKFCLLVVIMLWLFVRQGCTTVNAVTGGCNANEFCSFFIWGHLIVRRELTLESFALNTPWMKANPSSRQNTKKHPTLRTPLYL